MAQLEIKKMKQGMSYTCKEKTIILNVFKYFRTNFPDKCVTDIVRRTAKATGCSEKSIFQFRKEEASAEGFKEPSKTKVRKNININSRDIKYDSNVRQAIRYIIYDLKYRNIVPSLNTILKHVNNDTQLPNFSLMTLRRLMFDMGFYYEKNGNKSILSEKPIVNKDNVPSNNIKQPPKVYKQDNQNNTHINANSHKPPPPPPPPPPLLPQNICNVPPPNHIHPHSINQQGQKMMPMHMSMHDTHMMPSVHAPAPHSMPMMLPHSHAIGPPNMESLKQEGPPASHTLGPPKVESYIKREVPPWMYSYNMLKQQ
ncbi:hypothetical protein ILUMI_22977 [Ignelater luminosus]|uniref:Uncharacterized protein n=1 Tax=Ignelater luminosus TaxID=2038154 RepID=A0A8K0CDB4_IGNLU|nr:hypothetical protein ILUMI_22977 [Ignelater luminosus]